MIIVAVIVVEVIMVVANVVPQVVAMKGTQVLVILVVVVGYNRLFKDKTCSLCLHSIVETEVNTW